MESFEALITNLMFISETSAEDHPYCRFGWPSQSFRFGSIIVELSPGFKFDLNCYSYGINVTFRGNFTMSHSTDEVCYSFGSPGFVIAYAALFILLVGIILLILRMASGRGKQGVVVVRSVVKTPQVGLYPNYIWETREDQ
ncbi:unnamed protein product [Nippostrongylus brasiliensis]|uniref:CUB domain-containing protein n=1 Tax=Nippostrongylus brasiliensis TaxID=27835 RepID=A0A0N4YX94_NIPBR|nr:unnamed protein product [Nippostrongylus brasiliensis]